MTIEARIEGGPVLRFPDGTSQEVIQSTVRRIAQGGAPLGDEPFQQVAGLASGQVVTPERVRQLAAPTPAEQLAQETGAGEAFAISAGRGLAKIGRALGFTPEETEAEKVAFQALAQEHPTATAFGEAAGSSAPFLPAAVATGGISSLPLRTLASGAVGATEGALIRRGEGGTESEQIGGALIGGLAGGGGEVLFAGINRLGGKLVRKYLRKEPTGALIDRAGQPTAELSEALQRSGVEFEDIQEAAMQLLSEAAPGTEGRQGIRQALLEAQGFTGSAAPTRAQITRDPTLFQTQQELAKTSRSPVRSRLEAQQGLLANRFDETIAGTGGEAVTSGSPVIDHVMNKSTQLDNEIASLYRQTRERLGEDEVVDLGQTFALLRSSKSDDTAMKGLISSLEGEAKRLGILDPESGAFRLATVQEAETFRRHVNDLFNSTSDFGRIFSRRFRSAVDDDVTRSAGEDVFKAARDAKAQFESGLSRAKINKFDKRKGSLVRDMLENKVDPDRFIETVMAGKKYRAEDIKQLKQYMESGSPEQIEAGTKAFMDMRAETLDYIKNNAFKGAEDADGFKEITRARLERVINRIGMPKLKELLTGEELAFLKQMEQVTKILEPPRGTALGRGPSAQAVQGAVDSLSRRIRAIPFGDAALNMFSDVVFDQTGKVLKGKPVIRQRNLPIKSVVIRDVGRTLPTAGAAAFLTQGDDR